MDQSDALNSRARSLLEADRRLLEELVQRRKELDLTQAEVARRMDVSQSAVARIESGARDLHQSTSRRYAMAVDAMVEHHVIADEPARERSARIIESLKDQLQRNMLESWDNTCVEPRVPWGAFQARLVTSRRNG